ncbi:MAG TPA: hypothetical protein VEQ65_07705 [Opitutus sp.]|nr:hypothetical protein [Opitutus sp.]
MRRDRDREELLDAVLAEGAPAAERDDVLAATLRRVRGTRRRRRGVRVVVSFAAMGIASAVWWIGTRRDAEPTRTPEGFLGCRIVSTEPLPNAARVATQALAENRIVKSVPFTGTVHTLGGQVRRIDDAELLALTGWRAAIMRTEGEPARFILVGEAAER